jgi:hypothetical protein
MGLRAEATRRRAVEVAGLADLPPVAVMVDLQGVHRQADTVDLPQEEAVTADLRKVDLRGAASAVRRALAPPADLPRADR